MATINLATGERYKPRPTDYLTKKAACKAGGDCPIWTKEFLPRVTGDDLDLQDYLQRVAGYCLTGLTNEHVLFFLYGTGANGKTVFTNTLAGLMGDYAITAPMEAFLESRVDRHPTELAMLRGARLVVATETEAGRRWNESRIKALTGGDKIAARFMRGDFFEFTPQFKLMIAGNHRPALRNVDEAIRRRLHLIPFTVTIPLAERDDRLTEKLRAEWGGILQWALDGCTEWRRIGLAPPEAVTKATDDYLDAEDAVATWMDDCCTTGANDRDLTAALFASWKAWAEKAGERVGSMKAFSQELEARGFDKTREGGSGKRMYAGLAVVREDTSKEYWNQ